MRVHLVGDERHGQQAQVQLERARDHVDVAVHAQVRRLAVCGDVHIYEYIGVLDEEDNIIGCAIGTIFGRDFVRFNFNQSTYYLKLK